LCHKNIVGLYPAGTKFPVYCNECWFSDKWDPLQFGQEYDFSKPFFQQFKSLGEKIPRLAVWVQQSVNSEYTNQSYSNKDTYLSFAVRDNENVAYATRAFQLKQCLDVIYTHHSEFLYQTVDCDKSYQGRFMEESEGCVESGFLSNSRNCQNCFGGVNLRSASYMFFGEQLNKNTFDERIKTLSLGSRRVQKELTERFNKLKLESIYRFAKFTNTSNCKGDHLSNAKNCHWVFDGFELENVRYCSWVLTSKEIFDCYGTGGSEFVYEGIGVEEVSNTKFSTVTDASNHVQYADLCSASSNLFGCVGLRNKQYCILNKQYTKEEYEALVPKIIAHMSEMPYIDKKGRVYKYGEFFPSELSPFAYNETIAQENFPLTKEQVIERGYSWRDLEVKDYKPTKKSNELPDDIKEATDAITKEIIECEHKGSCSHQCSTAFRIAQQEFQLYQQMNIPLPVLCPNCRFYERLALRNPLKLWHRKCQCAGVKSENEIYLNTIRHSHGAEHCPNEFDTSYAPDRKEIVYCEQCYQAEVV